MSESFKGSKNRDGYSAHEDENVQMVDGDDEIMEPAATEPIEIEPTAMESVKVEPVEEEPIKEEPPVESFTMEPDAQELLGTEPPATEPPKTEPRDESFCSSDEDFNAASDGSPDRNSIDHPAWQGFIAQAVVEDKTAFERKLRALAVLREHYNVSFQEIREILLQLREEKSQVDLMSIEVALWKKRNAANLKKSKE